MGQAAKHAGGRSYICSVHISGFGTLRSQHHILTSVPMSTALKLFGEAILNHAQFFQSHRLTF